MDGFSAVAYIEHAVLVDATAAFVSSKVRCIHMIVLHLALINHGHFGFIANEYTTTRFGSMVMVDLSIAENHLGVVDIHINATTVRHGIIEVDFRIGDEAANGICLRLQRHLAFAGLGSNTSGVVGHTRPKGLLQGAHLHKERVVAEARVDFAGTVRS